MIETDIAHSGELHRLLIEYSRDLKLQDPSPEFWLRKFSDPTFFCLLGKHGKKQVGFVFGRICPYYKEPVAEIEAVFLRRAFRGKIKWARAIVHGSKDFLKSIKVFRLAYARQKRERQIKWPTHSAKV